ncbi:MAG: DMT family transporter [Blastochloris viridis]|uniref:DMT family transporter n=1 Tax=Blastochloris viridis TaxID=1079 RepID=A0A6N4RCF4_BLAVI|nr:MAG: DMT family transporter [Blastochloris viridis]
MMMKGIFFALTTVLLWGLDDVFCRIVLTNWTIQPIVFTSFASFSAAYALLIIAGPGKLGIATLRQPHTWLYSFLVVMVNIGVIYLLSLVSATEKALLIRISVIFSLIIAWMFLNRKPYWSDLVGASVILLGVGLVIAHLTADIRVLAVITLLITALFYTARMVVTETHPTSNQATTIKDRCRTTGYVLMATSFVFLSFSLLGAWLKVQIPAEQLLANPLLAAMPSLSDFTSPATVFAGILLGLFNISLSTYFCFYSTQILKSEVFLMISGITPVFIFGMEYVASLFGLLDLSSLSPIDLLAGALTIGGGLFMVGMRFRRTRMQGNL